MEKYWCIYETIMEKYGILIGSSNQQNYLFPN